MRKQTNKIQLSNKSGIGAGGILEYGGGTPIRVQSMLNMPPDDIKANLEQAKKLEKLGCELIRFSVNSKDALPTLTALLENTLVPIVADIHFNSDIAIASIEAGVAKVRINPGNIGGLEKTAEIAKVAKNRGCAIRVGVNAGSTEESLADIAFKYVEFLEDKCKFTDVIVSLKSSDLRENINSNLDFSKKCPHIPLHLGITEAGCLEQGLVKSSAGLAILLEAGVGDSIRYSLTDDPCYEVKAGYDLLNALDLRHHGVQIISCPTCARTEVDLIKIAREVEARLVSVDRPIKVAVMGCVVNGPGEAASADIGICCGKGSGVIIKDGNVIRKVSEDKLVDCLIDEIERL